jgi:GGDEF domain-containing protein
MPEATMAYEYRTERALGAPRATEFPQQHDLPQRRGYSTYAAQAITPRLKHSIHDVASVLGLSADAVSPALFAALAPVLEEMDMLRWQAEHDAGRRAALARMADRHSLLPCLNRRAFLRELDVFLDDPDCCGALALIAVGGIERLRRAHGLAAYDGAMRHSCATILGNLRTSDMVGCLGGSDFAVLMVADESGAGDKLSEIRRRVNDPPFVWMDQPVTLEPMVGVCPLTTGITAERALSEADRALRGI